MPDTRAHKQRPTEGEDVSRLFQTAFDGTADSTVGYESLHLHSYTHSHTTGGLHAVTAVSEISS